MDAKQSELGVAARTEAGTASLTAGRPSGSCGRSGGRTSGFCTAREGGSRPRCSRRKRPSESTREKARPPWSGPGPGRSRWARSSASFDSSMAALPAAAVRSWGQRGGVVDKWHSKYARRRHAQARRRHRRTVSHRRPHSGRVGRGELQGVVRATHQNRKPVAWPARHGSRARVSRACSIGRAGAARRLARARPPGAGARLPCLTVAHELRGELREEGAVKGVWDCTW
jgi:hypothetical protein